MLKPLCLIKLNDIYNNLEWYNNKLEKEIVNKVRYFNTIILSNHCLIIENPK